jgi:hypothetical protein
MTERGVLQAEPGFETPQGVAERVRDVRRRQTRHRRLRRRYHHRPRSRLDYKTPYTYKVKETWEDLQNIAA